MALPLVVPLLASIGLKGFLITLIGSLVFRALFALGFAYLSFVGFTNLIDSLKTHVHSLFSAVPVEVAHIMGLADIDIAINIMFGAIAARLLLVGMDKLTGRVTKLSILGK